TFTRHDFPSWGADGGRDGSGNEVRIIPNDGSEPTSYGALSRYPLRRADVVRIATAGGGGWGDPLRRGVDRVVSDVRNGFVTVEEARDIYGVRVDEDTFEAGAAKPRSVLAT